MDEFVPGPLDEEREAAKGSVVPITRVRACRVQGCVAIPTRGSDVCAVHGGGYRKHDGKMYLTCCHCKQVIRKGSIYRSRSDGAVHVNPPCV